MLPAPQNRVFKPPASVENILVIGGAGYIGSVLVRQLLARGYRVRVLDRFMFGREPILDLSLLPSFELLPGDFRNIHILQKATQQMDAIIHLGAIVGDPACALDERAALETNYEGTARITQIAKDRGISRVVFASTCSVYGTSNHTVEETAIPRPVSLYAATKADSEKILLASASDSLHPTVLRIGTAFGWSHRPRFDLAVNLLTAKAQIEGKIVVYNANQWRPFVHVRDIGSAFYRVLEAPLWKVSGQIFNLGSNETNHQLIDVARTIGRLFPEVSIVYESNSDRRDYRVSFDKIRGVLGFECRTSLLQKAFRKSLLRSAAELLETTPNRSTTTTEGARRNLTPNRPCGQLNLIPDRPQARHQPRQAEPPEQERSRPHFDAATAKRLPCLPWLVAPGRFPQCKPEPHHL